MSKPASTPNATPTDPQRLKAETRRDATAARAHLPRDPSIPLPGAAEKGERICDARSDPIKPSGVESVDKGA